MWHDGEERPLVLSWGAIAGRSEEVAAELAGDAYSLFPRLTYHRQPAPVRYAIAGMKTLALFARHKPTAIIVTNPPVFPGILALIYGRCTGAPVVLDDHPGSFGAMGDRQGARMLSIHRRMVAHARLCLVTSDEWALQVETWGGRALVFHEAPSSWELRPLARDRPPRRVLFACTFARDEPVAEVIEAARAVPSLEIEITGDPALLPRALMTALPDNVRLVGLLPMDRYRDAVYRSDAVLALTMEPTSAMRAAFEAVWAGRPLVVSDWPLLRTLFPAAVHVPNTGPGIAAGLQRLIADHRDLAALAPTARERQDAHWRAQLSSLRHALTVPGDSL